MINKSTYLFKNANKFGFGIKRSELDYKRLHFIQKYIVGNSILDVGCGSGKYVNYLKNKYPSFNVVGVDIISKFINYAKKYNKGKFIMANANKLPFKENSFDTVIMIDVLEHITNEKKVIHQLKRITKKRVIIIVPRETDEELLKSGLIFKHYIDRSHERAYTKNKLRNILKLNKIKIIKTSYINKIHTENLINKLFNSNLFMKKVFIRLLVYLFGKKNYYLDIGIVGEI